MKYDKIVLRREPAKLHAVYFSGDELAREKVQLLETAGYLMEKSVLPPFIGVPLGSVVFISHPVKWYAQALGFRNPAYHRFLSGNTHLWSADFVIGLRRPNAAEKLHLLDRAVLDIPAYLQKVRGLRSRC